jgi:hypothetical protein
MGMEKFPELKAIFLRLQGEKQAITAKVQPLRAERDTLANEMHALRTKIRDLDDKIKAIERPALIDIDNQLGALARGMGGRAMSDAAPAA